MSSTWIQHVMTCCLSWGECFFVLRGDSCLGHTGMLVLMCLLLGHATKTTLQTRFWTTLPRFPGKKCGDNSRSIPLELKINGEMAVFPCHSVYNHIVGFWGNHPWQPPGAADPGLIILRIRVFWCSTGDSGKRVRMKWDFVEFLLGWNCGHGNCDGWVTCIFDVIWIYVYIYI